VRPTRRLAPISQGCGALTERDGRRGVIKGGEPADFALAQRVAGEDGEVAADRNIDHQAGEVWVSPDKQIGVAVINILPAAVFEQVSDCGQ